MSVAPSCAVGLGSSSQNLCRRNLRAALARSHSARLPCGTGYHLHVARPMEEFRCGSFQNLGVAKSRRVNRINRTLMRKNRSQLRTPRAEQCSTDGDEQGRCFVEGACAVHQHVLSLAQSLADIPGAILQHSVAASDPVYGHEASADTAVTRGVFG